jgi:hypothetical protein
MRFDVMSSVAPLSTIQSCGRIPDVGVAVKAMKRRPVSVGAAAGVSNHLPRPPFRPLRFPRGFPRPPLPLLGPAHFGFGARQYFAKWFRLKAAVTLKA